MPSHCFVEDQANADRRNGWCRSRNKGAVCHCRKLETVELEHGVEHLSIDAHKNNPRPICLAWEKLSRVPAETEVLVKEDHHPDDEESEGRNGCWRPMGEQPFERNGLESPQKPDEGQEDICCIRADGHRPLWYHRGIISQKALKKRMGAIYLSDNMAAA